MATFPSWLAESIPDPQEHFVISYKDGQYISKPPGNDESTYTYHDCLDDAYYASNGTNVHIDSSVPGNESGDEIFFSGKKTEHNTVPMFFSLTEQDCIDALARTLQSFINIEVKDYREDPSDFMNAYDFIDRHPAFWTKMTPHDAENKTLDWNTAGYASKIWAVPSRLKDGRIGWMMEGGSHVGPEYVSHYHDLRLDVYGDSIEDCYIQLAAKLDKFFDIDGSERENVDYKKSELELVLEERLASINHIVTPEEKSTDEQDSE